MSLVELMVGVAVGLLVVAGATTVVATQLSDSRRLILETQLQQDLRASADIMTRELRRAGAWIGAPGAIWSPVAGVANNPNATITVAPSGYEVDVAWSGTSGTPAVQGFRYVPGSPGVGVLQLRDSGGNWQALTDTNTVDVTNFSVTLTPLLSTQLACAALCADTTQNCWPTVEVRELQLQITGKAVSDPSVVRSVVSNVRLRNDRLVNNNAGGPLCPT